MAKYRILEQQIMTESGKTWIFAAGESGDERPEGDFVNGSVALETDTRKVLLWRESINDWDDGSGN